MKITDLVATLQLGDRVRFSATLDRVYQPLERDPAESPYAGLRARKVWERRVIPAFTSAPTVEGIIVGARTVYDGSVEYGWEDNPTVFRAERSHRVYLVATSLRTKHRLVAVEDVEPVVAPLRIAAGHSVPNTGSASDSDVETEATQHWPLGSPA